MRRIIKTKIAVPLIGLILIFLLGFRYTDDIRIEKIMHQLELFRLTRAQQKVYVHTDKSTYIAGENIWVKAYVVTASDLLSDTLSKEVYLDLIDYSNKQIHTEILRNNRGFAEGYLFLSDTLAEGNYQVRAYTNWMRNFNEAYFFSKTISFKNPNYENVITRSRLHNIKVFNKKLKELSSKNTINFFPEGGMLYAGLLSTVAFKAESLAGNAIEAKGKIVTDKGKEVAEFASVHEGMGSFSFLPEPGMKYYAKVSFGKEKPQKFSLPDILPIGTSMSVNNNDPAAIKVTINSNKPISADEYANDFIIVGQSRGIAQYVSKAHYTGKPIELQIDKKLFPTGIVQITLFEGRSNPICERLVFIKQPEKINLLTRVYNKGTAPNDSIEMEFVLTDNDGSPVTGNFSLAVTNQSDSNKYSANIENSYYFSSDIKGYINNPGYYFDKKNPDADTHLDLLLLTQGWRRFVWDDLLANHLPEIRYQPSEGLTVGGLITRDLFAIPIRNSKVRMTVLSSYNDEYETMTNNYGQFNFPDLDYEDTISVKIEAFKPSGGKGVQIILTDTIVPEVKTPTLPFLRNEIFAKTKIKTNIRKERIEFKKNYKGKPEPDIVVPRIHNTPNDVIYVGSEASSYSNMFQYLQGKVPGVTVTGNKIIIRGVNTFYLSTDPLYLLDGVPVDANAVGSLPPIDVAVIEILKGPEAAIYGSRGANGVIAFYTKHGKFGKRGVIDFGMQGYQKRKEFYVAPYERMGYLPTEFNVPKTAYWMPTIKTDENGIASIKFKKVIKSDNYNFEIEGITTNGNVIHYAGALK
jgi:TonB-dependent SusC/RagA subfamily outer membrane receptor